MIRAPRQKAAVIFSGWILSITTGYTRLDNVYAGATHDARGSLEVSPHCRVSIDSITVEDIGSRIEVALTVPAPHILPLSEKAQAGP